jgi:hypothetical protein
LSTKNNPSISRTALLAVIIIGIVIAGSGILIFAIVDSQQRSSTSGTVQEPETLLSAPEANAFLQDVIVSTAPVTRASYGSDPAINYLLNDSILVHRIFVYKFYSSGVQNIKTKILDYGFELVEGEALHVVNPNETVVDFFRNDINEGFMIYQPNAELVYGLYTSDMDLSKFADNGITVTRI